MTAGLRRRGALVAVLAAAVLASSCTAGRAFKRGQQAASAGDWEQAAAHYTKAVQAAPDRTDYKIFLERAMIEAARVRLERARDLEAKGELETAIAEYRRVLEYNPANREALARATQLEKEVRDRLEASRPRPAIEEMKERARRQAEPPQLNPASRAPLRVKFTQASTQDILNFIGQVTGINVTYEREFRPTPFTIDIEGVTLEEALNQIMLGNQLWYKVINERTILVIPDNTQKRQAYEDQVIRTFYVSHAEPQELVQLLTTVTRVAGTAIQPTIAVNKAANTITVRATKGMADIIEKVIEANDRPRAEVIVDVEILEVSRARAKQYGLNLSQYQVGTIFSPEERPSAGGTGGTSAGDLFNVNTISQGISTADFYMTVPQAVVRFLASDSQSRQIAKPQLRGMEGEKLTLNLGDEIPVPSTVYTPIATGGAAINPLTSFSYRPVGVNIEMTPRVTYEGDIILTIAIESSNLGESVNVAGQSLPSFGSRKVSTRLRLREGESNLLAGLVSERDRKTLKGFPGIMNLPFLRQLLSDNDSSSQESDIVMLLTPRIVRTHGLTEKDLAPIFIGTQQNIGLTTAPALISTVPETLQEEAAPPAQPTVPPVGPAAPGMPAPPAAAPGMPSPATAAPPGVPRPATPGAPARLPEGATPAPVTPPGASPVPGTTTAPPPATAPPPVTTPPEPAVPATTPPEPAVPATPPTEPAPAQPAPQPSVAQVVLSSPSPEFRLGGGPYTIPVSITGASRVSTVSVSITFDPQVVRVRSVQEGSFLRQGGVNVAFQQRVDAAAGRVDITLTRTSDTTGASGAGLLAALLLEPAAEGSVTLSANGIATTPQGSPLPLAFVPVSVTVR